MKSKKSKIYMKPLSRKQVRQLKNCMENFSVARENLGGYPCNAEYDYSELYPFLEFSINNIGDPFSSSSYLMNTHAFEREVLAFFAKLFHLKGDYRGYIAQGSTEGNLYGLNLGLRKYPQGIIYFSTAAHYSIKKVVELIRANYCVIPSLDNGEINYIELEKTLAENKNQPAIINLTAGTTMTEATDDVAKVIDILRRLKISNYHIHVDAALSGLTLPFVKHPPNFDFASGIHSLVVSGHKFIGTPIPCGVVLTRQLLDGSFIEYANLHDTTIGGSRNGTTALFLWYAINRLGKAGLKKRVKQCLINTEYARKVFEDANIPCAVNPYATTIVFPRPNDKLIKKWQLLIENRIAHIVIKVSTNKEFIHKFVKELKKNLIQENVTSFNKFSS